jgi:hypothetical protein
LEDINLDGIDVDSDADQVSIGDDDREEFEVPETPKKGMNNHNDVEEEAETEYEDGKLLDRISLFHLVARNLLIMALFI